MPLFTTEEQTSQYYKDPTPYRGSKFLLGLMGYKPDGTKSVFGQIKDVALPIIGGVGGAIIGGPAGAALGAKLGSFAGQGLDMASNKVADNLTRGSDAQMNVDNDLAGTLARGQLGAGLADFATGAMSGFGEKGADPLKVLSTAFQSAAPAISTGLAETIGSSGQKNQNTMYNKNSARIRYFAGGGQTMQVKEPVPEANTKTFTYRHGGLTYALRMPADYKVYGEGDATEDLNITYPDGRPYGRMRLGERIFDQKSNLIMKAVMSSDAPETEKKKALGDHVFSELRTHDDLKSFAYGNMVTPADPPKKRSLNDAFDEAVRTRTPTFVHEGKTYRVADLDPTAGAWTRQPAAAPASTRAQLDRYHNSAYYRSQHPELAPAPVTPAPVTPGPSPVRSTPAMRFSGSTTTGTGSRYRPAAAPVEITATASTMTAPTGTHTVVAGDTLDKLATRYNTNRADLMLHNNLGDPNKIQVGQVLNLSDPRTSIATPSLKTGTATDERAAAAMTPVDPNAARVARLNANFATPPPTIAPTAPVADTGNLGNTLVNFGRMAAGASLIKDVPLYSLPESYNRLQSEIAGKKNTGYSAPEWAGINKGISDSYGAGVNSLTMAMGGGASPGSVLTGLTRLNQISGQQRLNAAQGDVARRAQNFAAYSGSVTGGLGLDRQMYEDKAARSAADGQAGAGLIQSGLQDMQNAKLVNEQYGSGSLFQKLLEKSQQKEQASLDLVKSMNQWYVDAANTPAAGLPDTSTGIDPKMTVKRKIPISPMVRFALGGPVVPAASTRIQRPINPLSIPKLLPEVTVVGKRNNNPFEAAGSDISYNYVQGLQADPRYKTSPWSVGSPVDAVSPLINYPGQVLDHVTHTNQNSWLKPSTVVDALSTADLKVPVAAAVGSAAMLRALRTPIKAIGRHLDNPALEAGLKESRALGVRNGWSEEQIARHQLDNHGITENQRKAYVPVVSNALSNYVSPVGYGGASNFGRATVLYSKARAISDPWLFNRHNSWDMYLGLPQKKRDGHNLMTGVPNREGTFSYHGQENGEDVYGIQKFGPTWLDSEDIAALNQKRPIVATDESGVMGQFEVHPLEGGDYQYRDRWDLHHPSPLGRIPVEKIIGKPFLSRGRATIDYNPNGTGHLMPVFKLGGETAPRLLSYSHGGLTYALRMPADYNAHPTND